MKKWITEYGHLALMCACLACSAVLLGSVLLDRPLVQAAETHLPVLRVAGADGSHTEVLLPPSAEEASAGGGWVLTEAYLESRLAQFLPESFGAAEVEASFEEGLLGLSLQLEREALKDCLSSGGTLGLRQKLALQMLPRRLEMEADFALSADENGLHLSPVNLELGDKAFDLTGLSADGFSAIDQGLNALLGEAGIRFSSVEFTDEGILFG